MVSFVYLLYNFIPQNIHVEMKRNTKNKSTTLFCNQLQLNSKLNTSMHTHMEKKP